MILNEDVCRQCLHNRYGYHFKVLGIKKIGFAKTRIGKKYLEAQIEIKFLNKKKTHKVRCPLFECLCKLEHMVLEQNNESV